MISALQVRESIRLFTQRLHTPGCPGVGEKGAVVLQFGVPLLSRVVAVVSGSFCHGDIAVAMFGCRTWPQIVALSDARANPPFIRVQSEESCKLAFRCLISSCLVVCRDFVNACLTILFVV